MRDLVVVVPTPLPDPLPKGEGDRGELSFLYGFFSRMISMFEQTRAKLSRLAPVAESSPEVRRAAEEKWGKILDE